MAELSRNPQEPGFDPSSPSPTTGAASGAKASPDAEDGLPLEAFAKKAGLAEAEVWKRLRRGELVGRTERGRLFVYATGAAAESAQATFGSWLEKAGTELPPLPGMNAMNGATAASGEKEGGFLSLSGERTGAPELALLLDHLSLAKEENREILRLTQESIRKVTELTDKIVEMKDQVIDAKEAHIMALQQQLAAKGGELRRLAQANEDLEMLARTMAEKL